MRHRVLMGSCALGAWVAAVAVKDVLRPAVASPMPPLARLALGSAPSLLSALAIPLFFLAVHPRPGRREIGYACLWSVGLVTVAEAIKRLLPGSTFDWRDLVAALVGIVVAATIARALSAGRDRRWRRVKPADRVPTAAAPS